MAIGDFKFSGQVEIQENIAKVRLRAAQFTKDAVNEHALNIQSQTRRNITDAPAVDTGQYRSSIKIETFSGGFAKRIGSDDKKAPWIEFGTRPHFPPLEPIKEWCRRHGIPESAAYAIALKISKIGTPAKPCLFPAFEQERPKFENLMKHAWAQLNTGV